MLGYAGYRYYQVLHTGSDPWITIKATSDQEVHVYDSIFVQPTYYSLNLLPFYIQNLTKSICIWKSAKSDWYHTLWCICNSIFDRFCHGNDPATCGQGLYAITSSSALKMGKWYPFHLLAACCEKGT